MTRALKANPIWLAAAVALVAIGLGCSTKSPTAPEQTPAPPPGTDVSAIWNIEVKVDPEEIAQGSTEPARVSVRVRKAGEGTPPPQGTTIVMSTSLGEFVSLGSGLTSIATATSNGRAETLFFPGAIEGTAVITAQLESSAGQAGVAIREGVVAAFSTANLVDNLSIQFVNLSTGDPRRFFWEFGDGGTSREENPAHQYAQPGDYVVTLRVERGTFSDRALQTVLVREPLFITDISPNQGEPGTSVSIRGQGFIRPLRVRFEDITADVPFVSNERNRIGAIVPVMPVDLFATEDCLTVDSMGMEVTGERLVTTLFDVTVETGDGNLSGSDTLVNSFAIFPPNEECVADAAAGGGSSAVAASFVAGTCTAGVACAFTDTSSPAGSIVSWFWDFGDGGTSSLPSPSHTFAAAGTFSVTLSVADAMGSVDTTTQVITVS